MNEYNDGMYDDLYSKEELMIAVTDCPKGAKTTDEIVMKFDGQNECENCDKLVFKNGVLSCKYSQV